MRRAEGARWGGMRLGPGALAFFGPVNIRVDETGEGDDFILAVGSKLKSWVHRKGSTGAMPAGHFSLAGRLFAEAGHPILLPGNPRDGFVVMVAHADD